MPTGDPLWRWSDLTLAAMVVLLTGVGLAMVSGWDGLAVLLGCIALAVVFVRGAG